MKKIVLVFLSVLAFMLLLPINALAAADKAGSVELISSSAGEEILTPLIEDELYTQKTYTDYVFDPDMNVICRTRVIVGGYYNYAARTSEITYMSASITYHSIDGFTISKSFSPGSNTGYSYLTFNNKKTIYARYVLSYNGNITRYYL